METNQSVSEPVTQFHALVLMGGKSRRCEIVLSSMEPALFALAATGDADLAAHCLICSSIWPGQGRRRRDIEKDPYLRDVIRAFFYVLTEVKDLSELATPKFYSRVLDFPVPLSKLFADYAAKGLAAENYPPK